MQLRLGKPVVKTDRQVPSLNKLVSRGRTKMPSHKPIQPSTQFVLLKLKAFTPYKRLMNIVRACNKTRWMLRWVSVLKIRTCRGRMFTWCPCQKWQLFHPLNHTLSTLLRLTKSQTRFLKNLILTRKRKFQRESWLRKSGNLIPISGRLMTLKLVDLWVAVNLATSTLRERLNQNSSLPSKCFTKSNSSKARWRVSFEQRLKSRVISSMRIFADYMDSSGITIKYTWFLSLLQVWMCFKKWSNLLRESSTIANQPDTFFRSSELSNIYTQRKWSTEISNLKIF